jgi:hypothetical protein
MNSWVWIAIIFTSPFWMVLGIIIIKFIFIICIGIIGSIIEIITQFLDLFKRK